MNRKQAKTLAAIFAKPVARTIDWADIEKLLVAVGCKVIEGSGSRVKFVKDDLIASFHRPHPEKEAKRYQVKDAREYLEKIGVTP
ncbi:MAG: type II toxin-antitoxin system HicA family toxin [Pseudomonadota bacterium]